MVLVPGLLLLCDALAAEPGAFARAYGTAEADAIEAIAATPHGIVGAGWRMADGGAEAVWIAVDRDGAPRWARTLAIGERAAAYDLLAAGDALFAAGMTSVAGQVRALVVRLGRDGALAWASTYGVDGCDGLEVRAIVARADGGVDVVGTGACGGRAEGLVLRVTADGAAAGAIRLAGPGDWAVGDAVGTADGGLLLVGATAGAEGPRDAVAVALDGAGAVTWARRFGEKGDDVATSVALAPDGGFFVGGGVRREDAEQAVMWRLSPVGAVAWTRVLGEGDGAGVTDLASGGGGVVATASVGGDVTGSDVYVADIGDDGVTRWASAWHAAGREVPTAVLLGEAGVYVAGSAVHGGGRPDSDALMLRAGDGCRWSPPPPARTTAGRVLGRRLAIEAISARPTRDAVDARLRDIGLAGVTRCP